MLLEGLSQVRNQEFPMTIMVTGDVISWSENSMSPALIGMQPWNAIITIQPSENSYHIEWME